jgi:hypothetical protein
MDDVQRKDDDESLTFRQTLPPPEEELRTLAETFHRRTVCLMKRRGMRRA